MRRRLSYEGKRLKRKFCKHSWSASHRLGIQLPLHLMKNQSNGTFNTTFGKRGDMRTMATHGSCSSYTILQMSLLTHYVFVKKERKSVSVCWTGIPPQKYNTRFSGPGRAVYRQNAHSDKAITLTIERKGRGSVSPFICQTSYM